MSRSTPDKMKGQVKEEMGALTGDDMFKHEDQKDQTAGKVKAKVEKGIDKLKDVTQ